MIKVSGDELGYASVDSLEADRHYVCHMRGWDDDGKDINIVDIVYCFKEAIVGQGNKQVWQFRFSKLTKTSRLSQLAGAQFYGPIDIECTFVAKAPATIGDLFGQVKYDNTKSTI